MEGRSRDVGRTRPLELQIRPPGDVLVKSAVDILKTSAEDVLKTSTGDIPGDVLRTSYFNVQRMSVEDLLKTFEEDVSWRYIEDHMWTSKGRLLGTSSGHPRDINLPSGNVLAY